MYLTENNVIGRSMTTPTIVLSPSSILQAPSLLSRKVKIGAPYKNIVT
jgi:hypothetical protein